MKRESDLTVKEDLALSGRVTALHEEVRSFPPALCAERALLVTEYFRGVYRNATPMILKKAGALAYLLGHKTVRIYPQELLVGNFTSHRVGGQIFPELHGVPMLEDIRAFETRAVNPFTVSKEDRRRLLRKVVPFWARRNIIRKSAGLLPFMKGLRFGAELVRPRVFFINEVAGVSHFVPDYQGIVSRGIEGYRKETAERLACVKSGSPEAHFLEAVRVVCDALDVFADRYRNEALDQAEKASDAGRCRELEEIAEVCAHVPKHPARTFREALQSVLFAQIILNTESLDNAVSPGRLDQILLPFYEHDVAEGRLTKQAAFDLLGCFAVKLCEIAPAFSRRATYIHGGLFNGQVLVVGGKDRQGRDATNEVTHLFLELMDRLRTRQPNYHARIHSGSPAGYRLRIATALAKGAVSPAIYNDEVIIPVLQSRGVTPEDARDYATVGCVEPVAAGKSFFSTDAALFILPTCLELALNQGRQFGGWLRLGPATPKAEECRTMEDLVGLFRTQVEAGVARLIGDIRAVERANAIWHPTPFTSMLLQGCMAKCKDASGGGAAYNGSGIQGVGVIEVGDSLAAIDTVVFQEKRATMTDVVRACRTDFKGHEALRARLCNAPKYGNDNKSADGWAGRVMEIFGRCFAGKMNTRGGEYTAGYYSVTSHVAFGKVVGALPSGRRAGEPFSSGISPVSGMDRLGPTAALRSQAALPLHLALNGVNYNLQLDPWAVAGEEGTHRLQALIDGGFSAGCMQMQINVLDPKILIEARDNPGRYPGLLVRVSGYSAYFDDLSPEMKQEIITRTLHGCSPA